MAGYLAFSRGLWWFGCGWGNREVGLWRSTYAPLLWIPAPYRGTGQALRRYDGRVLFCYGEGEEASGEMSSQP